MSEKRMGQKAHVVVGRTFRDVKGQWRVGWATTNSKWGPWWSFGSILPRKKSEVGKKKKGVKFTWKPRDSWYLCVFLLSSFAMYLDICPSITINHSLSGSEKKKTINHSLLHSFIYQVHLRFFQVTTKKK